MTDPITDMLNRISNAQAVLHSTVDVPFSNLKYEIAKILERQGFLAGLKKKGRKTKKAIEIILKYKNQEPIISGFKRISKPGQRIYVSANKVRLSRGGFGTAVLSTSKGLMTAKDAKKASMGGEFLFEIW